MKFILSTLLVFAIQFSFAQTKTIALTELQASSGIFFAAEMDQSASTIEMTMQGPDDKWFGIGFGVTMADSDPLIYTDGKLGAMHTLDVWDYNISAQNAAGVSNDVQQDWTIISNTTGGGSRTIVASRSLDTGDGEDNALTFASTTIDLVWAQANTADFTLSYHGASNRGSANLTWVEVDATPPALTATPFTPADDAVNVSLTTNLTVNFDESIQFATGTIELRLALR